MPAVLVEIAFISNPEEEKLLVSEAFQTKAAAALARGVTRFLGQLERAQPTLPMIRGEALRTSQRRWRLGLVSWAASPSRHHGGRVG